MMHLSKQQRFWLVIAICLVIGWLLAAFNVVPFESHAGSAPAAKTVQLKPASYTGHHATPDGCLTMEGYPCTWLHNGVRHAYKAHALGPTKVKVPAAVRYKIRKMVFARGRKFTHRVKHDFGWFGNRVWMVQCAMSVEAKQLSGKYYPRCMSAAQMSRAVKYVHKVTIGCGETAMITGVAGKLVPKSEVTGWAALSGYVGCAAQTMIDYANNTKNWLTAGFNSAVPGSHSPSY